MHGRTKFAVTRGDGSDDVHGRTKFAVARDGGSDKESLIVTTQRHQKRNKFTTKYTKF